MGRTRLVRLSISRDQEIQAVIQDLSTSYWLRDALKTAMQRGPLDVANDAEYLAMLFAKRVQKKAAEAMAWLAVQRAHQIIFSINIRVYAPYL